MLKSGIARFYGRFSFRFFPFCRHLSSKLNLNNFLFFKYWKCKPQSKTMRLQKRIIYITITPKDKTNDSLTSSCRVMKIHQQKGRARDRKLKSVQFDTFLLCFRFWSWKISILTSISGRYLQQNTITHLNGNAFSLDIHDWKNNI